MNVYDTANKLAGEIKQSEEYMNYKMAKQALSLNSKLKEQLQEFEKIMKKNIKKCKIHILNLYKMQRQKGFLRQKQNLIFL